MDMDTQPWIAMHVQAHAHAHVDTTVDIDTHLSFFRRTCFRPVGAVYSVLISLVGRGNSRPSAAAICSKGKELTKYQRPMLVATRVCV